MVAFLRRVIADLQDCKPHCSCNAQALDALTRQGIVNDDHELQSLAARCFRDGKPRLTLTELRTQLSLVERVQRNGLTWTLALEDVLITGRPNLKTSIKSPKAQQSTDRLGTRASL